MANKDSVGYGLNAFGDFLKNFVAAKQQAAAQQQAEKQFYETLALKKMETEQAQQDKQFQAYRSLQDDARAILGMGARQDVYDATGRKTGELGAKLTPEATQQGLEDLQSGFKAQYPGSKFFPPTIPKGGLAAAGLAPNTPVLPGIQPQPAPTILPNLGAKAPSIFGAAPAINTQIKPAGSDGGAGEKAMDEAFGRYYAQQVQGGGATSSQNVADLSGVAADLTSGKIKTGGVAGTFLPESAQRVAAKDISDARQRIQTVVFPTLRQIMGAQFTENEGQRVINATFDSSQPPEINAARALRLQQILQKQLELRKQAIQYWEKHGTLTGYRLPFSIEGTSADEIIGQLGKTAPAAAAPASSNGWSYVGQVK